LDDIKKSEEEKILKTLIFKPEIHENNIKNNPKPAEKVVINPDSYSDFISKTKKIRSDKIKEEEKTKSVPGSGKIWKCEITVPQAFVFSEMNNKRNKSADLTNLKNLKNVNKNKNLKKNNSKKNINLENYRKNSVISNYKNSNEANDKIKTESSLSLNRVNSKIFQNVQADKEHKIYVEVKLKIFYFNYKIIILLNF